MIMKRQIESDLDFLDQSIMIVLLKTTVLRESRHLLHFIKTSDSKENILFAPVRSATRTEKEQFMGEQTRLLLPNRTLQNSRSTLY